MSIEDGKLQSFIKINILCRSRVGRNDKFLKLNLYIKADPKEQGLNAF